MQKRRAGEAGFTLVELLIVIVILGILAAVVVFAVGGITDKGETSACKADRKTLEVAVEAYRAQWSEYPSSLDQLTTEPDELLNSDPEYWTIEVVGGAGTGNLVAIDPTNLPDDCAPTT